MSSGVGSRIVTLNGEIDAALVTLPTDKVFRNAWALNGTVIDYDLPTAKQLLIDELLLLADTVLEGRVIPSPQRGSGKPTIKHGLNSRWQRALAKGDTQLQNQIESAREKLRNIATDSRITNVTTIADLKALRQTIIDEVNSYSTQFE